MKSILRPKGDQDATPKEQGVMLVKPTQDLPIWISLEALQNPQGSEEDEVL